MGNSIREHSDDDQDPREEFLVEYQEETKLEIQDIQLEAGMPKDTANRNFLSRGYLENHFPHWEKQFIPTKAKIVKNASGKMRSIRTIIKEIIIPHRKGNIRLNPELLMLEDPHNHRFSLGTDYQRIYGIDIYNSKNRHITIGTNKEKKVSLNIYNMSNQDLLEEFLNKF
ncbi:hypothetical protein O181_110153 [Austropuccinia psidii MF-1]|uniref:Uncharacterized protein n=1 Tax=Austropuccinia psidii MF-1 TaxID=1389203 RepID=A0A9Q3PQI4_9BASI|nr:hypothetical protein [Austropuccinia psidii MF-1]